MDVKEVSLRDTPDSVWGWCCSACNTVWFDARSADDCCQQATCSSCSAACPINSSRCGSCSELERQLPDVALFEAATKVWYPDYDGIFLYWPVAGGRGEFFRSRTDIEKYCVAKDIEPPRWVWACEQVGFLIDAEAVLAGARDSDQNPIRDLVEDPDVEKLQDILDEWVMARDLFSHRIDYNTAVVIDRALMASLNHAV